METIGRDLLELSLDTVRGDDERPLSVHTVVSNDDLLTEILVRLPVVSLVLFKSVSKRWQSLIKSPTFIRSRSRIHNIELPSGLFIQRDSETSLYSFAPFDSRIPYRLENSFKTGYGCNSSNATVLHSCNGLFLCFVKPDKLCVYNPTVNQFKMLPEFRYIESQHYFTRMAFDPTKSPHYKVVHAVPIGGCFYRRYFYRIYIYSSETGIWSIICSRSGPFVGLGSGIYCNDAIHWINHDYDDGALHFKLEFVNNTVVLTKIRLPVTVDEYYCKLFESRGKLLLLGKDKTQSHGQLNVYEMGKGDSEWSLKYSVNQWSRTLDGVWCIALGEREEDSVMVIELNGNVVLYNFVLKTFRGLPEVHLKLPKTRYSSIRSFLFIASFARV